MKEIIFILAPAVVTIIGNIIFYKSIQSKAELSLQRYSITYSGIFMERLKVYRTLLEEIFNFKSVLLEHINDRKREDTEMIDTLNNFLRSYKINEPLLSDNLLNNVQKLERELRQISRELFYYKGKKLREDEQPEFNEIIKNAEEKKKLFQRIYNNDLLKQIEKDLVKDMKEDFHLKHLK